MRRRGRGFTTGQQQAWGNANRHHAGAHRSTSLFTRFCNLVPMPVQGSNVRVLCRPGLLCQGCDVGWMPLCVCPTKHLQQPLRFISIVHAGHYLILHSTLRFKRTTRRRHHTGRAARCRLQVPRCAHWSAAERTVKPAAGRTGGRLLLAALSPLPRFHPPSSRV